MVIKQYNAFPGQLLNEQDCNVFATSRYASLLHDTQSAKFYWFEGKVNGQGIFLIPFSVRNLGFLRKGVFHTAPLSLPALTLHSGIAEDTTREIDFLNALVAHLKKNNLCDWVQQPPNWAIFSTVPEGATHCRFGTYKVDLQSFKSGQELFDNIATKHRGDIRKSMNEGVEIKTGVECLEDAYALIKETAEMGHIAAPDKQRLLKEAEVMADFFRIYVAYYEGRPQSAAVFFGTQNAMYGLYTGSIKGHFRGANTYLMYYAMNDARERGVKYLDFVGGRVDPDEDSKLYRIQKYKEQLGGVFHPGFLWKIVINKNKYLLYKSLLMLNDKLKGTHSKGDIIDQENNRSDRKENPPSA